MPRVIHFEIHASKPEALVAFYTSLFGLEISDAGELLGKIHIPETVANLCFGGQQRNRLYICGSSSLYAVYTSAQGAMKP